MAPSSHHLLPLLLLSVTMSSPFLAFASSPHKVSLVLYYETLCPYCSNFIVNYLSKIFNNGFLDIVDLTLVPYGNARVGSNASITCQHGPYECLLNTFEACAIHIWPDVHKHFAFIYCVESLVVNHKYTEWESCLQKLGLDSSRIWNCYNSGDGKELELQYAAQTDALEPPHRYVPWVVVDGRPLYEDYQNFETYICKAYKGTSPSICRSHIMEMETITENQGGACHAEKILHSPTFSMRRPTEVGRRVLVI